LKRPGDPAQSSAWNRHVHAAPDQRAIPELHRDGSRTDTNAVARALPMRLSAGKLLALVAFTLIATGCVEDVPLGQDYDKKYDVVVVFCHERIHIQETCTPVEASTSDFIYTYGLFGKAAGHSITVTTQVKGDDWRHESNPVVVPHGRQWLDGTRVSR